MKLLHRETTIPCPKVSTLLWDEDVLTDATTNLRVGLDGSVSSNTRIFGYPFDRAVGLRHGGILWAVVYTSRATKGVLLKNGKIHRELNRSFDFANAYDYPVAVTMDPVGRVVVIHCPNSANVLEVEDAETGIVLVRKETPDMEYHSRLAVSANGRYLLDTGWFWHPLGGAWVCDLHELLRPGAGAKSSADCAFSFGAEIDSGTFLDNDRVVLTSTDEVIYKNIPATGLGPNKLGIWSMARREWQSVVDLKEPAGAIMAWGKWIISMHQCPKVIDSASGAIIHRWDHLYSGRQIGSIELGDPPPPPMAFDPKHGRFAIGHADGVTVITLAEE